MLKLPWISKKPPAPGDDQLSILEFQDLPAFEKHRKDDWQPLNDRLEWELSWITPNEPYAYKGFCYICQQAQTFTGGFDRHFMIGDRPYPLFREGLWCPKCQCNNRMRAGVHLASAYLKLDRNADLYATEQITNTFKALKNRYPKAVGSEFLGDEAVPGSIDAQGRRHEDVTQLTFADNSLDAILTFDVLEHVPDYNAALREFHRTLRPGGKALITVPFMERDQDTLVRAKIKPDGEIEHLEPPDYHGDPVTGSCLCFYYFGWDMLDRIREAGFGDAHVIAYYSKAFAYLGFEQMAFVAVK